MNIKVFYFALSAFCIPALHAMQEAEIMATARDAVQQEQWTHKKLRAAHTLITNHAQLLNIRMIWGGTDIQFHLSKLQIEQSNSSYTQSQLALLNDELRETYRVIALLSSLADVLQAKKNHYAANKKNYSAYNKYKRYADYYNREQNLLDLVTLYKMKLESAKKTWEQYKFVPDELAAAMQKYQRLYDAIVIKDDLSDYSSDAVSAAHLDLLEKENRIEHDSELKRKSQNMRKVLRTRMGANPPIPRPS